jgi:asparagine synthase (glutamine-hydrolysing)
MLEWSPGETPRLFRYWRSDVMSAEGEVDLARKTKEFEELFLDSVNQRLLASDVPVGVMLSGGLDSSAVAAAAVELGHKRFHTFSVGFSEGGEYSEIQYARKVGAHLGVEHHQVIVDQTEFLDALPEVVRAADEPLADLTLVPLLAVSRLARKSVKVVLSGEGADEVLAGYNFHEFRRKMEIVRRIQSCPFWIRRLLGATVGRLPGKHAERLAQSASVPLSTWNVCHKNHMSRLWIEAEKVALWPAFVGRDSDSLLNDDYAAATSEDPLDQILFVYQQSWLVEDLLMKADKMSMACSLELRVPFLDYRLVEWANRQPVGVKIGRAGWRYVSKHVLRRFAKARLPREIIERPKRGFPVPAYNWFQEERFRRWASGHLTGRGARLNRLFGHQPMEMQLHRASMGDQKAAHKAWLLIVLEMWLEAFDVESCDLVPSASLHYAVN